MIVTIVDSGLCPAVCREFTIHLLSTNRITGVRSYAVLQLPTLCDVFIGSHFIKNKQRIQHILNKHFNQISTHHLYYNCHI